MAYNRPGILLINKPAGPSSAAVVGQVKRKLNARKVGHAGTLDPPASGLLILLLNGATRVASFAGNGMKEYAGTFEAGITTDTDDCAGTVLSRSDLVPGPEKFYPLVSQFTGSINQTPPNISAVKVDGERAYARSRRGEELNLTSRKVFVERFSVYLDEANIWNYSVRCSKGTYVRSLIRDFGEALGCGAAVKTLVRTASDPFTLKDACTVEAIDEEKVLPWDSVFEYIFRLEVEKNDALRLLGGDKHTLSAVTTGLPEAADSPLEHVLYEHNKQPLGLLARGPEGWRFAANIETGLTLAGE